MGVVGLEQNGLFGHAHMNILFFGCVANNQGHAKIMG